jgi:RNA polymerase sigma-70 factor (ECF subfamily)
MSNLRTGQAGPAPQFVRSLTGAQFDLYAFLCMVLGNREVAKDVLQDTNVRLMSHAGEYDAGRAFLPWAKAFAYNQARTYLKRESRSRMVFDDELMTAVADESMTETAESGWELELLDACIERLTSAQKELIQARYFRRESIACMAERLKRSAISVYVQIHRIRRLLRLCIESQMHADGNGVEG